MRDARGKRSFDRRKGKGFTLIEAVVAMGVAAIILLAMVSLAIIVLRFIEQGRVRVVSSSLANERMEILRNMPYDSLATQNGPIYPPGSLLDNEAATRSGFTFNINTVVAYVDDPFDGNYSGTIPGKPVDLYPYDYKKAQITVVKLGENTVLTKLVTNIAAKAAETPTNTGILAVTVLNAQGVPFNAAVVSVTNSYASPPVNITTTTDSSGQVMIPMLPPDDQFHYKIEAAFGNYSLDSTYPPTESYPNPFNPNANIIVQQVTYKTLSIDQRATLVLDTVDAEAAPVPNLSLLVTGDKRLYLNPDLYKTQFYATTSASGQTVAQDLEWDSYAVSPPASYYICSSYPLQKIALSPAASVSATLVVTTLPSAPRFYLIAPSFGSGTVEMTITGVNFSPGLSLALKKTGEQDIVPTVLDVSPSEDLITATFDLTGKALGEWDIRVTNPNGEKCYQKSGMTIQ